MESERSIYLEFYAPVNNNLKAMPGNNDLMVDEYVLPTDDQINSVIYTGENLTRRAGSLLTAGQRNAVIFWIDEHPEFMLEYMAYINELVPAERQINDIIYLGEWGDHDILNIISNIDLPPAIDTDDSSSDEDSSDEGSSDEDSSDEGSSDEDSSDYDLELTDDEDAGLTEN